VERQQMERTGACCVQAEERQQLLPNRQFKPGAD
jgi:hypothetical protein